MPRQKSDKPLVTRRIYATTREVLGKKAAQLNLAEFVLIDKLVRHALKDKEFVHSLKPLSAKFPLVSNTPRAERYRAAVNKKARSKKS